MSIWCLQRIFPRLTAHFTLALASHMSHHIYSHTATQLTLRMPLRGTSHAPRFEGDPHKLQQYFEDVELLCEDVQLFADEDRI